MTASITNLFTSIVTDNGANIENLLIQLGEQMSTDRFMVGDIVNIAIENLSKAQEAVNAAARKNPSTVPQEKMDLLTVGIVDVYDYAAQLVSCSRRSIQNYSAVAKKFSQELRDKYSPLRYTHFLFALQHPNIEIECMQVALRYIAEHGGKLPPVSFLEVYFGSQIEQEQLDQLDQTPQLPEPLEEIDDSVAEFSEAIDEVQTDPDPEREYEPATALAVIDAIQRQIEALVVHIKRLPINEATAENLDVEFRELLRDLKAAKNEIDRKSQSTDALTQAIFKKVDGIIVR